MKTEPLAIHGGIPVRRELLPYGRQWIDDEDIAAVVAVLKSPWLTTGPIVAEFERAFADACRASEAVAVSNGTAALHACMHALDIGRGDEVIVSPMTFAASSNCILYAGGTPVFADVDPNTLLIDPAQVEAKITQRTKAVIAVDYAGQPCDYAALRTITSRHGIALVADACHSLGASYQACTIGTLADMTVFSLHPVKHITTGEGGVVTTNDAKLAQRMRIFRTHGIVRNHAERAGTGPWYYEMVELGYNYRITDFQCALGLSQLRKLPGWVKRRQEIAGALADGIEYIEGIEPLAVRGDVSHAYHLFVVQLAKEIDRGGVFAALHAEGIGVNVHYVPVHLHPYYRRELRTKRGLCPIAESAYERILSLPMFPQMNDADVGDVLHALQKVLQAPQ